MDLSTNEGADRRGSVHHDTHATPPNFIQREHWRYQSMRRADVETNPQIVDIRGEKGLTEEQKLVWKPAGTVSASHIMAACEAYHAAAGADMKHQLTFPNLEDVVIYENTEFPGLQVLPGLLPPETQVLFTSCLMHRDLADPGHKINLQADYNIPYPEMGESPSSFFVRDRGAADDVLQPKDEMKNKPVNNEQFLYSRLRWLTLGEQYDWPTRSYAKHATPFPQDLSTLVTGLFPHIRPESGVVLIYSSKDFMPVHRDVSEQCQRALASFSVGCDGIFIMAKGEDDGVGHNAPKTVAIRVRSGDCVHLEGDARWAWHAMARTIPGTCPPHLKDWPVGTGTTPKDEKAYKKWKGYMATKRINVSCRQVWD